MTGNRLLRALPRFMLTRNMVGSPFVAALIARWGFWILMLLGLVRGDLTSRSGIVFLVLWVVAFIALRFVPQGELWFVPYVACLDIALVFAIFKGDVRIT
jgi:hypothetical protein